MTREQVPQILTPLGAEEKSRDLSQALWRLDESAVTESKRSYLQLVFDEQRRSIVKITWMIARPDETHGQWRERYTQRWGEPQIDKHLIGGDRADEISEATVWIDRECDIKATLLAIKQPSMRGVSLRSVAIRLEQLIDPVGHLTSMREELRDTVGR